MNDHPINLYNENTITDLKDEQKIPEGQSHSLIENKMTTLWLKKSKKNLTDK